MSTVAGEVPSSSKRKKSSSSGEKHPEKSSQSPAKSRSRVFSESDEVNLLKAFHEILKDSPSPATAATLLFDRVGKSLSGDISQTQLIEKLRKLRQKYSKQLEEKTQLKTPHDEEVFEISNKIWGENPAKRNSKGSAKKAARRSVNGKKKEEPKTLVGDVEMETIVITPEGKVDPMKNYSYLMEEVLKFPEHLGMKESLKCLDGLKLGQLNDRWRLQQIKEAEILVKRTELIKEQTKLILDALVPSSSPN